MYVVRKCYSIKNHLTELDKNNCLFILLLLVISITFSKLVIDDIVIGVTDNLMVTEKERAIFNKCFTNIETKLLQVSMKLKKYYKFYEIFCPIIVSI